jgi:hypothetical protein
VEKSGSVVKTGSNQRVLLKSDVAAVSAPRGSGGLFTDGSSDLNCTNLECLAPFSFRQGRLFRFYHNHPKGNAASMNQHFVKHLWLCKRCTEVYTLEYREGRGLLVPLVVPRPLSAVAYSDASLLREETSLQEAVKTPKRSLRRLERHMEG